jgi:hypothetical protein
LGKLLNERKTMPIVAPWLHPPDFIGAASHGASLGLQARGQDQSAAEFAANLQLQRERATAADALRRAQEQMLGESRRSTMEHQRALELEAGRRLDLTEAGQEQHATAADALLQARYDLAEKAQDARDERQRNALDDRDERQRKSLEAQRSHAALLDAYSMRRKAHDMLLKAQGNKDKEGIKTFQSAYDDADGEIIRLEEAARNAGGDSQPANAGDALTKPQPTSNAPFIYNGPAGGEDAARIAQGAPVANAGFSYSGPASGEAAARAAAKAPASAALSATPSPFEFPEFPTGGQIKLGQISDSPEQLAPAFGALPAVSTSTQGGKRFRFNPATGEMEEIKSGTSQ